MAVGRLVLNPLFRVIGRFGERELFIVAGLFTVIGASAVMPQFGLSMALGALVAGVILAESPYRHEIESDVEPFRSILLGLFFLSVGMLLDLGLVLSRPLLLIGLAVSLIVTKSDSDRRLCRLFGNNWPRSVRLGLLLSQAGEFGFVLFGQSTAAQLISPQTASLFSAVVTLSMVATPFLMRLTDWLERREVRGGDGLDGPELSPETSAIVVGYGRFGQTVAQMMQAKSIGVTVIDKKPGPDRAVGEFGYKVYYGDGLRLDLLRTAGAETARVIAFCNDNEGGEMSRDALCGGAQGLSPGVGDGPGLRPACISSSCGGSTSPSPSASCSKAPSSWAGPRSRRAGSSSGRSVGSNANIGCAIANGWSGRAETGDIQRRLGALLQRRPGASRTRRPATPA